MMLALLLAVALPVHPAAPIAPPVTDWVISAGTQVRYNTSFGPVDVSSLIIETGATLRVVGPQPFRLRATRGIRIDGTLDLSGFHAPDVTCIDCADLQSPPGLGGAAGGWGGIGNVLTTTWNAVGGDATDALGGVAPGGKGGDSGYKASMDFLRRPGGGGGGALGPDLPLVHPDPDDPLNNGFAARSGFAGTPGTNSAVMGSGVKPRGGASTGLAFVDSNGANDFWGREWDPSTGQITIGELAAPIGGRGGGGGGDTVGAALWPPSFPYLPSIPQKGAGGGGGGGLGILSARVVKLGPAGTIRCNGGDGGSGEWSDFGMGTMRVGGGGGGGSGGMLILQARVIDLRLAGADAIVALGGAGGHGGDDVFNAVCAGGSGGPGLIQLHVPSPSRVLLPLGTSLDVLTLPSAHILLLETLP